jgi:hypothetical protein
MNDKYLSNPLELDDYDLVNAVFHNVLHVIGDSYNDPEKVRQILQALSSGRQMVYYTVGVDMQVQNGGFNQYFWNVGRNALEALKGFEILGAYHYARIMMTAITQFVKEKPALAKFYDEGTLQAFSQSYGQTNLGDVDLQYYDANKAEPLEGLLANFIRRHGIQFELQSLEKCCFSIKECELLKPR